MDDAERMRKALWDNLHSGKQVSANLLGEQDIDTVAVDNKTVLRVRVPRAARQDRPVHVGSNPLGGTYIRRHEGAYPLAPSKRRANKSISFSSFDMNRRRTARNSAAHVEPAYRHSCDQAHTCMLTCAHIEGHHPIAPGCLGHAFDQAIGQIR